ncbi:MAG: hypothetical protein A2Y93_16955 [Chloroflexi bacterium RBG_13_68_17]|nr:MAG: hypothetical protein A2Y93_16955 [Chloroflexi bacterium RBG_13_68_17]
MAKIVTVEEMRAIESAADASGLTYAAMMENAGRSVAAAILERFPDVRGKRVAVLVGGGNNGGDGLVAADYLAEAGAQVGVYLAAARPEDDANLARVRARGLLVAVAEEDQRARVLRNLMTTADIVLDALLGTGFRLPLRGAVKQVLAAAGKALEGRNEQPFVVALDCPSGMDCDTGEAAEETLRADLTVTLAAAKPGLFRFPGAERVGELSIADIGVPEGQAELAGAAVEVASAAALAAWLPSRPRDAHKGTFGRALVVAGSVNFPGAAVLAGLAAYRVGAGLVTLGVPSAIHAIAAAQLPEATWIILPHELGVLSGGAADVLRQELESAEALLLGPGFGQDPATAAFLARLLGAEEVSHRGRIGFVQAEGEVGRAGTRLPPTVVDADGLKLLVKIEGWPARLPAAAVLTPHPGEMSVLTGEAVADIQADRIGTARRWAETWGHVVVLKGAFTVVAAPGGEAMVLPFATPALARAGTGDVLAGAIVGLLAQGLPAFEAAVLAAFMHARAGEIAAAGLGTSASVLASEVADALPEAIAELEALRRR